MIFSIHFVEGFAHPPLGLGTWNPQGGTFIQSELVLPPCEPVQNLLTTQRGPFLKRAK